MDISSRLNELRSKHAKLEEEIEKFLTLPSKDSLKITELKREKLYIKEQIMRLLELEEQVA